MAYLAVVDVQDTLHQVEVHVFVHICLLQALTGHTRRQKQARLDVYAVASVLLAGQALVEEVLVLFLVYSRGQKLIHFFLSVERGQLMKLLQSQGFQCRSISFIGVNDETGLHEHFRFVGSNESLLQPGTKDDVLGIGLVFL